MTNDHVLLLLLGLLSAITVGCGLASLVSLVRVLSLQARGAVIDGVVVSLTPQEDGGFAPVVEYTVGGAAYRVESNRVFSREDHPLGTSMRVLYAEDEPAVARVTGSLDLFGPALALFIASVCFGGLAGGLAYLMFYYR